MCITFFYRNSKYSSNEYRFILIFNRDEFYKRKTSQAHFWNDHPTVIGGRDTQSESSGTWLAASTRGKIGILVNLNNGLLIENAESRGVLVSKYVTSNISPVEYIHELENGKKLYNGYQLILFHIRKTYVEAMLHTNVCQNTGSEVEKIIDETYGFSNCRSNMPFEKINVGKQKFEKIVKQYNLSSQKDTLVVELLNLLKSVTRHYPDKILYDSKKQELPESIIEKFSSIFVKIPELDYGTRTHTIILIDSNNVMEFLEFTMMDENSSEWGYKEFKISLELDN